MIITQKDRGGNRMDGVGTREYKRDAGDNQVNCGDGEQI